MATFGPIASAAPNVLFDAAKLDRDVQGFQRNQLLMQNAQQDQAAQQLERDWNARSSMARQLAALPEDQAASAWATERQRLQAAGFGHGLPEQFPGMERIRAVASSDLSTFQRMQIEEKRRATEGLMSLLGGGVPAMSGSGADAVSAYPGSAGGSVPAVPASMPAATPAAVGGTGSIRADNNDATRRREWAMANLSGPELEAELASISAGRASALTGQGPGTQYRANPGVGGVYAGVEAPRPGTPVLSGGGQAGARPASSGLAFGPRGLTQEQERILAVTAISNPAGAAAQMAQFRQQNAMAARQQAQDERQRVQDERRLALDERRAKREDEKDAREAPGGPIRGNGLNNSLMNILITGDPASPEYAAAYGRLGAEEVNPATGAVRRPDMSMFRAPTYVPPGNAPAGSAPPVSPTATAAAGGMPSVLPPAAMNGPVPAGDQPMRPASLGPAAGLATASTVNALSPQAQAPATGGRAYGQAQYRPGSETSANDRTKLRQIETEANGILEALETFRTTRKNAGFPERAASAVGLPTELNSSYGNLALLAKGEALYNLGVLNGPDLEIIRRVAADPGTMAGGFATQATVDAQLNQIKGLLEQRLSTARQQFGGAGAPAIPAPGASGSRPPLSSFRR